MKMEVPENEVDELTLLLRNIQGTDRQVNMIINKNIPSYISLEGKKIRVWYHGQDYTCARCLKSNRFCKEKAVASKCKEPKADFESYWAEIVGKEPRRVPMDSEEEFDTDTISMKGITIGVTNKK